MAKRYIIDLTQVEKETLVELTRKGRPGARKVKRANILLLADLGKKDEEIVSAFLAASFEGGRHQRRVGKIEP